MGTRSGQPHRRGACSLGECQLEWLVAPAHLISCRTAEDQPGAKSKVGEAESDAEAHDVAAGRKRIAATQRARWAALKAKQKKAA